VGIGQLTGARSTFDECAIFSEPPILRQPAAARVAGHGSDFERNAMTGGFGRPPTIGGWRK
jgi:hypothetical protein